MNVKPYSVVRKVGDTNAQALGSVELGGYIPDITTTGTITFKNGSVTVLIVAAGALRGQLIDFKGAFFDLGLSITLSAAGDVGAILVRPR